MSIHLSWPSDYTADIISELDGYVSFDGQSDFDEADMKPRDDKLDPTQSTSSDSVDTARPAAAAMQSDSGDESALVSDSSTEEISVYSCAKDI